MRKPAIAFLFRRRLLTGIMTVLMSLLLLAACGRTGGLHTASPGGPPGGTGLHTAQPGGQPGGTGLHTAQPGGTAGIEMPELLPPMPLPEYPVIDGSSSTLTMHAAIRAYLTDAYLGARHSQTYGALERLIPGSDNPADVVLAVKYYDETLDEAESRGADLVITPIAKEGFIFIVHKDNPIDKLTTQQLKDIFSGKIKNWKELGGKDEKIVPVHRNWDSGSQTAMEDFMGDVPLTDLTEDDTIKTAFSMSQMLETVWTTGSGAIGYNIFSWSTGHSIMLSDKYLKFVTVDGTEPSIKNLADNSYPLLVYTYSYYNRGNDKAKYFTDWLLTEEGQNVIASAGYVGIFGTYLTGHTMPDFTKDVYESMMIAENYYYENGIIDLENSLMNFEQVYDDKQVEKYAAGMGGDVMVLYVAYFRFYDIISENEYMRYIVLTRERGGKFRVINEGEIIAYEDGVITG